MTYTPMEELAKSVDKIADIVSPTPDEKMNPQNKTKAVGKPLPLGKFKNWKHADVRGCGDDYWIQKKLPLAQIS